MTFTLLRHLPSVNSIILLLVVFIVCIIGFWMVPQMYKLSNHKVNTKLKKTSLQNYANNLDLQNELKANKKNIESKEVNYTDNTSNNESNDTTIDEVPEKIPYNR